MADFMGTSGDDVITGTDDSDFIDVSQGGNDTVNAEGGDDTIFVGAALNKGDRIDGGDGFDTLQLDGDYSRGIKFAAATITNIEQIDLAAGHSYHFILANGNVTSGATLTIDGSLLGSDDSGYLDGSKVKDGALVLNGGAGNDTLIGGGGGGTTNGGDGNDTIFADGTDLFNARHFGVHIIDGGNGNDEIFAANGDTVTGGDGDDHIGFGYSHRESGDLGHVDAGAGDDIVDLANADIHAGELQGGSGNDTLYWTGTVSLDMSDFSAASSGFEILQGGGFLGDDENNQFDFSGFTVEAFGTFFGIGGLGGDDIIIGSNINDHILGGDGDDRLTGGFGKDVLGGGSGADIFVYETIQDSGPNGKARDIIADFHHSEGDLIDLSAIDADTTQNGNQAFHLGGSAFTDTAGELIQFNDGHGHTILEGDVNGDGIADFAIEFKHAPVLVDSDFIF